MRCDDVNLKANRQVQITSSIEAGELNCQAGVGGFTVGKRLGIGRKGRVDSAGGIKIGSVFSMMRELADGQISEGASSGDDDLSMEAFMASM